MLFLLKAALVALLPFMIGIDIEAAAIVSFVCASPALKSCSEHRLSVCR